MIVTFSVQVFKTILRVQYYARTISKSKILKNYTTLKSPQDLQSTIQHKFLHICIIHLPNTQSKWNSS